MNKPNLAEGAHVHMIGIGGSGMSGLAVVMSQSGYQVSGSDRCPGAVGEKLRTLGVAVHTGHDESFAEGADLVVASAAIPEDNPEILFSRRHGVPIISRAEMLGWLMSANFGIAVAGTHGKTTTSSMLAVVLEHAGLDPTVLVGGDVEEFTGNAKVGRSELLVAEACEAFGSFWELAPEIAVVTNVEADHLDFYGSLEGVINGFRQFLSKVREGDLAVVCADCPNIRDMIPNISQRVITYGLEEGSDCRAYDVDTSSPEPTFHAELLGSDMGEFRLRLPGEHNARNALAVIAVSAELGIGSDAIRAALWEFRGAGRRFEVLGTASGITIVDDYAHHPTEIRATLAAARAFNRRIVAVFQPHLYSRTKLLADEFAESLKGADEVFLTDIYAAREAPTKDVSSEMIVERMARGGFSGAHFVGDKEAVPDELIAGLRQGDLLVVMGAGDIRCVGEQVLERLSSGVRGQ